MIEMMYTAGPILPHPLSLRQRILAGLVDQAYQILNAFFQRTRLRSDFTYDRISIFFHNLCILGSRFARLPTQARALTEQTSEPTSID